MEPSEETIDSLAQIIRQVDGSHSLGAAALAEAILSHPDFVTLGNGKDISEPIDLVEAFEKIAQEKLLIPTLVPRERDRLDFHEVGVYSLGKALQAAYELGQFRCARIWG